MYKITLFDKDSGKSISTYNSAIVPRKGEVITSTIGAFEVLSVTYKANLGALGEAITEICITVDYIEVQDD